MNTIAKKFRNFVRLNGINGKIAAEILNVNTTYFYQKMSGAAKVMESDLKNLRAGYKKYLREKIREIDEWD